ncbi:glutathione S-transferase [Macrolepiota fuliginosa MF-IS2]|uniref:glutathione transferase n=1 Tax=Macrolepiota fuliginosa MF-IS2 TaxID=1400762 RepID=A0A9P5XEU4_9AGAR|nr:glutathione S-transferase [Macrolepiota fuliginosa MF-IS2]
MVLKFYAAPRSPPAQLVAITLHEKNIPFEFIEVNLLKGEHKLPGHLEKHPFGQVPVIDDDGFILYESNAIAQYLDEKYPSQGTKLIPTDFKKRALFNQAVFTETSSFSRYASPLAFEVLFISYFGGKTDPKKVEELTKNLTEKLDVYEQILSKQKYLAGNELTLADLQHIPFGTLLPQAGFNFTQNRPNVARWFNELSSRKSWQKVKEEFGLA